MKIVRIVIDESDEQKERKKQMLSKFKQYVIYKKKQHKLPIEMWRTPKTRYETNQRKVMRRMVVFMA